MQLISACTFKHYLPRGNQEAVPKNNIKVNNLMFFRLAEGSLIVQKRRSANLQTQLILLQKAPLCL